MKRKACLAGGIHDPNGSAQQLRFLSGTFQNGSRRFMNLLFDRSRKDACLPEGHGHSAICFCGESFFCSVKSKCHRLAGADACKRQRRGHLFGIAEDLRIDRGQDRRKPCFSPFCFCPYVSLLLMSILSMFTVLSVLCRGTADGFFFIRACSSCRFIIIGSRKN